MSRLSQSLKLRIPSNIIYLGLKDTRLETLFPEFFIGVERKVITDIINKERFVLIQLLRESRLKILKHSNLKFLTIMKQLLNILQK
jgi:hypothetical protein